MRSQEHINQRQPDCAAAQAIDYLTRINAADFLRAKGYPITKGTLQKLACIGGGPAYRLFGNRALYSPVDLVSWAEARLSAPRSNTSEAGCA